MREHLSISRYPCSFTFILALACIGERVNGRGPAADPLHWIVNVRCCGALTSSSPPGMSSHMWVWVEKHASSRHCLVERYQPPTYSMRTAV
ncbi:hypothetical protein K432DRAFT_51489 [Lepidopterella palustris CBS 459.81]|uniref:Secreted protein n=1 Tax=Lepidopterella palustris CBS 459.81 TaxID=1314670 RepID=A0A8E2EAS1_9PEZI|nr:hypothetical protein K432DRAFT_51489 [Lepidopterella palustris CBS 459.81]